MRQRDGGFLEATILPRYVLPQTGGPLWLGCVLPMVLHRLL